MEIWSGKDITPEVWERVRTLFEAALEQEADQRAAFLAQNCPEESIRRQVEELLANHDKAGDFLVDPVIADFTASAVRPFPPTLSPGTLLAGRFKVVRFIAEGGMGEVYEAEDLELHEHLAIKTLRQETLQEATAIARFKREVHLARKVTHPNVCRIYDLFRDKPEGSEEIVFVSMEFLRGETLASRMRYQGRMGMAEALPLITQMASALSAAHEAGIVHGDFKPGNVVLVEEPAGIRAVVTDFGLAFRAVRSATDPSLSGTSWLPVSLRKGDGLHGTPAYMAPEQLEGQPASKASDIYSFGLVIFEMVTGARPFQGDTPISTAAKRLAQLPPPPRKIEPSLSPVSESVILRCLERDPAKRFEKAQDVARALAGGVKPLVTKRFKSGAIGFSTALVFLTLTLCGYLFVHRSKAKESTVSTSIKPRRSIAVLGFRNVSGRQDEAWLSGALSEAVDSELAAGENLRTIPGENVARMKMDLALPDTESYAADTLLKIQRNLGTDFVVEGSYVALGPEAGGQIRLDVTLQDTRFGEIVGSVVETGKESDFIDLFAKVGADLRAKLGVRTATATEEAAVRASVPSNKEAARYYAEGLDRLRKFDALGARDALEKAVSAEPKFALAHSALSAAWSQLGYDQKSKEQAKMAFDLSSDLSREDQLSIKGRYHSAMSDWNGAIETYRTLWSFFPDNLDYGLQFAAAQRNAGKTQDALVTVETLRKLSPPARDEPSLDLYESYAAFQLSDFKRAQAAADRAATKALAIGSRILAARALISEGVAFDDLGEYVKALATYERAREIAVSAGDRGQEARALYGTSIVLEEEGDYARARKRSEDSLAISREIGNKHGALQCYNEIAIILKHQGDLEHAREMFEESLRISREVDDKSSIAIALGNLGHVFESEGDLARAVKDFEQVATIFREIGNKRYESMALTDIGYVHAKRGDLTGADRMFAEALQIDRAIGNKYNAANVLELWGAALLTGGDLSRAKARFTEGLDNANAIGEKDLAAIALSGLADVSLAEGDLTGGRSRYEQALKIQTEIGEKGKIAESWVALGNFSVEGGHPADALMRLRDAREEFRKERDSENEVDATTVLARALLVDGKFAEALNEMDTARALVAKCENRGLRLNFAIIEARIRAASGKAADAAKARKSLEATLAEAIRFGILGTQFEARLALGETEMKLGQAAAGRSRLAALEKDARAKDFLLVAHKAAAAAKG